MMIRKGIIKKCIICGAEFYARPSRAESKKCCSRECSQQVVIEKNHLKTGTRLNLVNQVKWSWRECPTCKTNFQITNNHNKFCSSECFQKSRPKGNGENIELKRKRDLMHNNIRRVRKSHNGTIEKFTNIEIYNRYKWVCHICNKKINSDLKWPHRMSVSIDHIIPISKGGSHTRANVKPAHLSCNVSKHTKSLNEQLILFG